MFKEFKRYWGTTIQDLNNKSYDRNQCQVFYHSFKADKISILMYEKLGINEYLELDRLETSLFVALESAYSNYRKRDSFLSRFFGIFKNRPSRLKIFLIFGSISLLTFIIIGIISSDNKEIIVNADYVIELGPGAGRYGGKLIFEGNLNQTKFDISHVRRAYNSRSLKRKFTQA